MPLIAYFESTGQYFYEKLRLITENNLINIESNTLIANNDIKEDPKIKKSEYISSPTS